ncbi:MAG: NACHT domain-containing protein [Syntrophales bacterium]
MAEEFDINAVIATFINQNIDKFIESSKGLFKNATYNIRLHLDHTYSDYLKCVLDKHSKVKSFFIRMEPVNLYKFYVPLSVRCRNKIINKPTLADVANYSHFLVIAGSGGSGKSMFMRHLLLNSIITKSKVPVFIELRQFNDNGHNLFDLIHQTLTINKFNLDCDYTSKAIQNGHFAIFLDGFDEIIQEKRQAVTNYILEFTKKYDKNYVLVSSRPDSALEGWPGFGMLYLEPLTLEQADSLIKLLPYDEDLKRKFADDLKSELFIKHNTFLSNPLLLSIMLLTYGQSANIPNKLNVFYNQAYEALFERHDALKGGFQRKRRTKLDIQDFARVFSCFCIQTYDKRKFEFSQTEALEYIEKAKQISQLNYDKTDYLKDALQAVCLLVEEGITIVFSHRSFQEYFTARFIAEAGSSFQPQLIQKYSRNVLTDNVMELLYEIRPDLVEQHYILPMLNKLFDEIGFKKSIRLSHYVKYLKATYGEFHCIQGGGERDFTATPKNIEKSHISDLISFTLHRCGHLIRWRGFDNDEKYLADIEYMCNTYGNKGKGVRISTKTLSQKHPFVCDLSDKGMFFSIKTLRMISQIRNILIKKALLKEHSLEDILRTK